MFQLNAPSLYRKLIVILCCFLFVTRLMATNVSGNVSGTWDYNGSPYNIIGAITVLPGTTLTIKPGVKVIFPVQGNGGLWLDIKGTLKAVGKEDSMITFQGPGADGLDGYYEGNNISGPVIIESSSTNSILQHVLIDGMGYGRNKVTDDSAAISIRSGYCTLTDCIIKNVRGTGVFFRDQFFVNFSKNVISNNRVGLKFSNLSNFVKDNEFTDNIYLDVITELDNLTKLTDNNPLHIGLTANLVMKAAHDTLKAHNIDYRVLAGLTIPSGKTLDIEPGVKVIFPAIGNGGLFLDIKGTLMAKGTEETYITFQGPGADGLDGYYEGNNISGPVIIESPGSSTSSVLQYILIDGMGYGRNQVNDATAAIDVKSSYCSVNNCIIQNTRGTGVLFESSYKESVIGNNFSTNRVALKFENTSGAVSNNIFSNSDYLDVITELDNMEKLDQTNSPLHIGFTSNLTMSQDDKLTSYNYDYRLLEGLTVSQDRTLTIEPGVTLKFPAMSNGGLFLDVKGTLIAKGTAETYITFQGPGADGLDGYYEGNNISGPVIIESTSVNSVLKYITFNELGYGRNKVKDSTAVIRIASNCTNISNCIFQDIRGTGITIQSASPLIDATCFNNNSGGIFSKSGKANITNANFVSNANFAVKNMSLTDTVTATNCWWNSILGPTNHKTNPVGGEVVSDMVLFTPWLTESYDCSEYTVPLFPDCTTGLLPLTLLNFNVVLNNNTVNCSWQTTSEVNTSYFKVQRSWDGVQYTDLQTIAASGNSSITKSYGFVDKSPNMGMNYYRLKMVDADGRYSYSKTMPINVSIHQPFAIYPNPVPNILYVQLQQSKTEKASIQILDMKGKMVQQQSIFLQAGTNTFSVNTTTLAKGTYFLIVRGQSVQKKMFIKE